MDECRHVWQFKSGVCSACGASLEEAARVEIEDLRMRMEEKAFLDPCAPIALDPIVACMLIAGNAEAHFVIDPGHSPPGLVSELFNAINALRDAANLPRYKFHRWPDGGVDAIPES